MSATNTYNIMRAISHLSERVEALQKQLDQKPNLSDLEIIKQFMDKTQSTINNLSLIVDASIYNWQTLYEMFAASNNEKVSINSLLLEANETATTQPLHNNITTDVNIGSILISPAEGKINLSQLFNNNDKLENVAIRNITEQTIEASNTFGNMDNLLTINLGSFKGENVTDMSNMCSNCPKLQSVIMSLLVAPKLTTTEQMFYNCSSLTHIDLNIVGESLTNVKDMFNNVGYNTTLTFSYLQGYNITNAENFISNCQSLPTLYLPKFTGASIVESKYCFGNNPSLVTVSLPVFNPTSSSSKCDYLFANDTQLINVNLNGFVGSNVRSIEYMFYNCSSLVGDKHTTTESTTIYNTPLNSFIGVNTKSVAHLFDGCTSFNPVWRDEDEQTIFNPLPNFIDSSVTNYEYMFNNCSSAKYLDLSKLTGASATSTAYMFNNCSSLEYIDLTNFVGGNVTNIHAMFANCSSLTRINLLSFIGTGRLTLSKVFENCSSLETVILSEFIGNSIVSITDVFNGCNNLKELMMPKFNPPNSITSLDGFGNIPALERVTLTSLVGETFVNFPLLSNTIKYYDLPAFNSLSDNITITAPTNIEHFNINSFKGINSTQTSFNNLFASKLALTRVEMGSFIGSNINDCSYMFSNCNTLQTINLKSFTAISSGCSFASMFENCSNITFIDIRSLNISNSSNLSNMFAFNNNSTVQRSVFIYVNNTFQNVLSTGSSTGITNASSIVYEFKEGVTYVVTCEYFNNEVNITDISELN